MSTNSSNNLIFKNCEKNKKIRIDNVSSDNATLYLNLRKNGCSHKQALVFSKKKYCRYDNTRNVDGPASHRILRPTPTSSSKYNTFKGWDLLGNVNYTLQNQQSKQPNLELDQEDEFIDENIQKLQVQDPETYAFQINSIQNYLDQVHKNVKSHREYSDKREWAKQLNQQVQEELQGQRYYIELNKKDSNLRLYETVRDLDQHLDTISNIPKTPDLLSSSNLQVKSLTQLDFQNRPQTQKNLQQRLSNQNQKQNILKKFEVFPGLVDDKVIQNKVKITQPKFNEMASSNFGFLSVKNEKDLIKQKKLSYYCLFTEDVEQVEEEEITPQNNTQKTQISLLPPPSSPQNNDDDEKPKTLNFLKVPKSSLTTRRSTRNSRQSTRKVIPAKELLARNSTSNLKVAKLGGILDKNMPTGIQDLDQFSQNLDNWIQKNNQNFIKQQQLQIQSHHNLDSNQYDKIKPDIHKKLKQQKEEIQRIKLKTLEKPLPKKQIIDRKKQAKQLYSLKNLNYTLNTTKYTT